MRAGTSGLRSQGEGILHSLGGENCLWIGSLWVSDAADYIANLERMAALLRAALAP